MTVGAVASVVVGLTLLVAGGAKLFDRNWQERELHLGSPGWVLPFLPPLEIVVGALVAVRVQRMVLALVAMLLMLTFTVFLLVKWEERSGEPCNCFGVISKRPVSAWTIVRNTALIVLALVAAFID